MSNETNPTNQINISSITGGVNNIGSQVENQTVVNNFGSQEPASIDQVYEVILRALPADDKAAVQAAIRLLELEAAARKTAQGKGEGPAGADQDAAVESQTILARYKPQIVAALQEMGLAWLQTAFPMVAFVRPLIKIAIDAWNEAP